MSDEKKDGLLKQETIQKLELCMEMAATDAIDLITEGYGQDLFSKEGRGDKVWFYKGSKEALTNVEKIKSILQDHYTFKGDPDSRKQSPEAAAAALLESVAKKLDERNKHRPS